MKQGVDMPKYRYGFKLKHEASQVQILSIQCINNGGLTHLGECHFYTVEAVGSNPTSPTKSYTRLELV